MELSPTTYWALRRLGAAVMLLAGAPAAFAGAPRLGVDGTEFVVAMPDGRKLRSADLVGATLKLEAGGRPVEIVIESVEEDRHAVGGRVVLHSLLVKEQGGRSIPICRGDAQGRNLGFPVPDGRGGFDLTCTSGAIGKCIRWGYRPWDERPGGAPLAALHRACVHMARADYGGDGQAHTRNGTLIDMQDGYGIQRFETQVPMAFEAAWGFDGAVCIARPRIADLVTLTQLAEHYPKLHDGLGPQACSEEQALRQPATLLFNRSFR